MNLLWLRSSRDTVSLDDCYLLARQLAVLQRAGVPVLSSLQALQTQLPSPALRTILGTVRQDLTEGRTLSQALAQHPRVFGPVFLGLVRVGEAGGMLDDALGQLAQLLEWELELRHRIRDALQYPLIVLCTLGAALAVIATFVLPRFATMFQSFRIPLPLQTRLLIALSNLITHEGWLLALLLTAMGAGWWAYLRTDEGRMRWHTWKLRLPLIGSVLQQLALSRVARVTAALTHSGVSILDTLSLAGESVNNRYVRARLELVRERVRIGTPLAAALRAEPLFPPVVIQMVATGEETGRLDELLRNVSEYYDQQSTYTLKKLITYLEPLLLIVVGLGVLVMATAVFVPMWDLVKIFKTPGR